MNQSNSNIMSERLILENLQKLPENLRNEVLDFIAFLVSKNKKSAVIEKKRPKFGSAKGKYEMSSDFDAPLEDFKEYM